MTSNRSNSKKSLILGSETFSFIANIASSSMNLPTSNLQETKPKDDSKENMEIESLDIDQSLASNLVTGIVFSKESDSETITESRLDQKKSESFTLKKEEHQEEKSSDFNFKLLSKAENEFSSSPLGPQNVTKGCKWSPDGTCILTNSEDTILRLFDLNEQMLNSEEKEIKEISSSLRMTEPEIIYDYAWYPFMNSNDPLTACVFSTCKDNPIHLYDAYTGQIRCSYKGYNHLDELVSAYSIAFDSNGTKIYCGYDKCLKIFDISVPGRNFQDVKLYSDQYKIPGIISCIAFPKTPNSIYAVGSYTKFIGIFVENTNEAVCLIQSHKGGLTHLMFSEDGNKLFSGARKDSDIFCWDIRNPGKLLQVFKREVKTNQRIYFDLFNDFNYLASGNNDGSIRIWNANEFDISKPEEPILHSFLAHNDCVNGLSFHPTCKLLATSSGQRKIFNSELSVSSDSDDDNSEKSQVSYENSLKIWKY